MSSSEICGVVNALTRTVFDLQLNSQNFSKDLCIFNTDFYKNRRLILFSFLTYDYITTECVRITCDELNAPVILELFLFHMLIKDCDSVFAIMSGPRKHQRRVIPSN